jgi:hypothetical protein
MTINQSQLASRILSVRYRGTHGTPINMHRSLRKLTLTPSIIFTIIFLPVLFDIVLWTNLEVITKFWGKIFEFWITRLNLEGSVDYTDINLFGKIATIPFTNLPIYKPSQAGIWTNIIVSALLLTLSKFIAKHYMPLTYILRAVLIIQVLTSLYCIFSRNHVLYDMQTYISGMLVIGIYMILLISPFLALIYYIFDFPVWQKILATILIVAYFIFMLPFQYMMHAFIISSGSLLFMPTLYLLFGVLLNTLMFVGSFAWIMTWKPIE